MLPYKGMEDFSPTRMKLLRKRARLSRRDVVRETGLSRNTLSSVETGKHTPHGATLRKLLDLYFREALYWQRMSQQAANPHSTDSPITTQ